MSEVFSTTDLLFLSLIWKPILIVLGFSCLASFFSITQRYWTKKTVQVGFSFTLITILPLGLLGYTAGHITGISRSPIAGNVIPAILTLIGALNVYIFGWKSIADKKVYLVGYSISVFAILFFYGVQVGAFWREYGQEDRLTNLADQEWKIRHYRRNLELPEDPPAWMINDPHAPR